MWWKKQAPTTQGTQQGQIKSIGHRVPYLGGHDKGMKISLTPLQTKVKNILSDGGQHSTADISTALHIGDPRSIIRGLRRLGIPVVDVWVMGQYGVRFKRYFICGERYKRGGRDE